MRRNVRLEAMDEEFLHENPFLVPHQHSFSHSPCFVTVELLCDEETETQLKLCCCFEERKKGD